MNSQSQNFWDFSTALYARERVADSCLDLQNTYQIDINLLLFCYWHGLYHGPFADTTLNKVLEFSRVWKQEVVQPLRNVRSWMKKHDKDFPGGDKSQFETLRGRIKFDELGAERYQQEMLEHLTLANGAADRKAAGMEACNQNIEILFARIALQMNDLIAAKLKVIVKALDES